MNLDDRSRLGLRLRCLVSKITWFNIKIKRNLEYYSTVSNTLGYTSVLVYTIDVGELILCMLPF